MTPIVAPSAPDTLAAPRIATEILAAQKAAPTLPPWAPRGPLLSALQPKSASAQKKLVAGLPTSITVKPSSTGLNPKVSSSGDIVQATLSVLNKTKTDDVIAYYKSQLAKAGLAGSQSPSQGGGIATCPFMRAGDNITLTVSPTTSVGSRYTLFRVWSACA